MRKYILLVFLLLAGCGGGSLYNSSHEQRQPYGPRPMHNLSSGQTEWVNELCCPEEGEQGSYMNYDTGEVYVPLQGPGNLYIDSQGELYQPY